MSFADDAKEYFAIYDEMEKDRERPPFQQRRFHWLAEEKMKAVNLARKYGITEREVRGLLQIVDMANTLGIEELEAEQFEGLYDSYLERLNHLRLP